MLNKLHSHPYPDAPLPPTSPEKKNHPTRRTMISKSENGSNQKRNNHLLYISVHVYTGFLQSLKAWGK